MPPSLLCSITIKLMSHSQTTRIKIFLWHRNYISKQVLEPKKRRNIDVWGKIHRPITNFRLRGEIWYSVVRSDELKLQEIYTKCFILYYLSRPLPGGICMWKKSNSLQLTGEEEAVVVGDVCVFANTLRLLLTYIQSTSASAWILSRRSCWNTFTQHRSYDRNVQIHVN